MSVNLSLISLSGDKAQQGFTTSILHCDRQKPIEHGSLHKPIHDSVAFEYNTAEDLAAVFQGRQRGFAYGRQGNPTVSALEDKITLMEQGVGSVCFATGMAAISATMFTLLRAGDHLISSSFLFGNTDSLFKTLRQLGVDVTFVDVTDVGNVIAARTEKTKAVFVETIANPCTQVTDLKSIGDYCEREELLYIVDNTLTTPFLFQPNRVKAGLIINSLTKYVGGHGNVLGGSVTESGIFDWSTYPNIYDQYKSGDVNNWGLLQIRKKGLRDTGATLSANSAHLLSVGAETLALRMSRTCDSAQAIASYFESHRSVKKVFYPGVRNHPDHNRAKQLFSHFGSLLSIELGDEVDCFSFLNALKLVVISSNLGDNRTLAIPVAHTIYYEMGPERRASMGISDGMIRFSVGIEDVDDLITDFEQALHNSS
ncbi:MAG: cystathionine gamma-synthase family protein [Arenicellales bacterium]|nr:cystathionine gamma-synthase family protein [Arenicellales bacterium]